MARAIHPETHKHIIQHRAPSLGVSRYLIFFPIYWDHSSRAPRTLEAHAAEPHSLSSHWTDLLTQLPQARVQLHVFNYELSIVRSTLSSPRDRHSTRPYILCSSYLISHPHFRPAQL